MRNVLFAFLVLAAGILAQSPTRLSVMEPARTGPADDWTGSRRALSNRRTPLKQGPTADDEEDRDRGYAVFGARATNAPSSSPSDNSDHETRLQLVVQGSALPSSASASAPSMRARGVQNADYGVQNADYSATPTGSAQASENTDTPAAPAAAGDASTEDGDADARPGRMVRMGRRYVQNADYSVTPDASVATAAPTVTALQQRDINARVPANGSDDDDDCDDDGEN